MRARLPFVFLLLLTFTLPSTLHAQSGTPRCSTIESFDKAIQQHPDSYYAYKCRADAYFLHHDFELAIRDYAKVNEMIGVDDEAYARSAWSYLYLGDGRHAFEEMLKFLNVTDDDNPSVPYMLLVGHLGLRRTGHEDDARSFLSGSLPHLKPDAWTTQIVRYMIGQLTEKQLFALAGDGDKKIDANTFVGMNLSLSGNRQNALEHLRVVADVGKSSLYGLPLAESEIRRLESQRASK